MSKIDTSQWTKFTVGELFLCETTNGIANKNTLTEGDIPYITRSAENNGQSGTCGNKSKKVEGNCITIGAEGFTAFYQEKDFVAGNKVYALRHPKLNKENALYFVTALNILSSKYSFNDARVLDRIKQEEILLPSKTVNEPDWDYIEEYIKNLKPVVSSSLTNLLSAKMGNKKINISKWKSFHLYDIFDIDSGTKLDKVKMDTSMQEINFVGRSNFNNGITEKIKRIDGIKPYAAGNLTLALGGAYLGSCFVQKEEFYTSQNVVVLIPKQEISDFAKQFIATAIFKESQNNYCAFINELNSHIKTDFEIKLPVKKDDTPDYDYMDKYIESVHGGGILKIKWMTQTF